MPPSLRLLAALALAPAAAAATAADGVRLAVVTLEAPPTLRHTARSAAEALAREAARAGAAVMGPAEVEARLGRAAHEALVRCGDDAPCAAERGRALGVERIVTGRLTQARASYRVALVHADARTGERLGGLEREIPVASRRLLKDVADAAPVLLASRDDSTGVLRVTTEVPGAEVTIDDVPAGTTPLARMVKPGQHKVQVAREGFVESEARWVEVPANGIVEHRPRIYRVPPRDRPNASATEGQGTEVRIER
jgi:hypothetical protein